MRWVGSCRGGVGLGGSCRGGVGGSCSGGKGQVGVGLGELCMGWLFIE